MSAADLRVLAARLIAQTTGAQPLSAPNPNPVPPLTSTTIGGVSTVDFDCMATDIGSLSDCGDDKHVLVTYGDSYGTDAVPTYAGITTAPDSVRDINELTGPINLESMVGSTSIYVNPGSTTPNWGPAPFAGYASISGPGITGPGGYAIIQYFGKVKEPVGTIRLDSCLLLSGSGTLSYGTPRSRIHIGDPRQDGGLRNNLIAESTTVDLSAGIALDRMQARNGVATEPFGRGHRGFYADADSSRNNHTGDIYHAFPLGNGAPAYSFTEPLVCADGAVVAKTNLPAIPYYGGPIATGAAVMFAGVFSYQTTNAQGSFTASALPSAINVASTVGMVGAAGTNLERRCAIECTNGAFMIVQYTAKTDTQLQGCTLVIGAGWSATVGGKVVQGIEFLDLVVRGTRPEQRVYDVRHDGNANTFRVTDNLFPTFPNRAGGPTQGLVFRPYNKWLDPENVAYNPDGAPRAGTLPMGGTWVDVSAANSTVPGGATDWDGNITNKRQIMNVMTTFGPLEGSGPGGFANFTAFWYSDDGGAHWAQSAMRWNNTKNFDAIIQSINPHHFADGYVYSISQPNNILIRCAADYFDSDPNTWDSSAWKAYNQTSGTWETVPTSGNLAPYRLWIDTPYNGVEIGYLEHFDVFYATYAGFDGIYIRLADALEGPWGPARQVLNYVDYPAPPPVSNYYAPYGGWVHPFSGKHGNAPDVLYMTATFFVPYQVYWISVLIVDPKESNANVVDQYDVMRIRPGGGLALWDSWIYDTNAWTRTGPHSFTIAGDATGYLNAGTKVSYNDGAVRYGIVGSVSFSAGTTTVYLIPNTSFSMAATTIAARRYSHADAPPGFPDWFAYSPAVTGFATPPVGLYRFRVTGRTVLVAFTTITNGVSGGANGTQYEIGLPIAARSGLAGFQWTRNLPYARDANSNFSTGRVYVYPTATVAVLEKVPGSSYTWTASGTKGANGAVEYEF